MKILRQLLKRPVWLHQLHTVHGCCSASVDPSSVNVIKECHDDTAEKPRSKYLQVAVLMAYNGNNYYGMEMLRNTQFPTVEAALFRALALSGAVPGDGTRWPRHYSRASRTDRGVSALGQVVSLRMRVWDGVVDEINRHLPDDVRVHDVRRVPPRFTAQSLCDDRLYSYTLPTFGFAPMTETVTSEYRLPESRRQDVYQLFQQYVGTHSFHSFSPKGDASSQQMTRQVLSIDVGEPYIAEGLEFITIWIRGRSFVLSQIRRMVGLAVAVCRGAAAPDAIQRALRHQRLTGITAPGLGLVLRQARFETFAEASWNQHGALRWSAEAAAGVRHLERRLLQHIHSTEAEHHVTFQFLDKLLHNRLGAPVVTGAGSRSALGYALRQTLQEEEAETQSDFASDRTEVTSDHTEAASDYTEVTSEEPEVTCDHTEAAYDYTEAASGKPEVTSDRTEVSSDRAESASDRAEAASDRAELTSDRSVQAVVEPQPEQPDAVEVSRKPRDGV